MVKQRSDFFMWCNEILCTQLISAIIVMGMCQHLTFFVASPQVCVCVCFYFCIFVVSTIKILRKVEVKHYSLGTAFLARIISCCYSNYYENPCDTKWFFSQISLTPLKMVVIYCSNNCIFSMLCSLLHNVWLDFS